jgi:NuA3 HAT complex component NTO1
MNMPGGIQAAMYDKGVLAAYCDRHTPEDYSLSHDVHKTLSEAIKFYAKEFRRHRYNVDDANIVEHRRKFKKHAGSWRTEEGMPVLPRIIVKHVISALTDFYIQEMVPRSRSQKDRTPKADASGNHALPPKQMQELETFAYEMARYWVLKRQQKRGAALSKRLQLAIEYARHHHFSKSEAQERLEKLENSIGRVQELSELVSAIATREDVKLELARTDAATARLVYFPLEYHLEQVWRDFKTMDEKADLLDRELLEKVDKDVGLLQYHDVEKFIADVEHILTVSLADCQRKSKEWGVCSRYQKTMARVFEELRQFAVSYRGDQKTGLPDFRNFNPNGLSVDDEMWTGRRVLNELSDSLTELDSDEYEELVSAPKKRKLRHRR